MSKQQAQGNSNTRKEGLGFDGQINHKLKIKNLTKEKLTTKQADNDVEPEKAEKASAVQGRK